MAQSEEVSVDDLVVGEKYIRVRKDNPNERSSPSEFVGLTNQGAAKFDAGDGAFVSDNPSVYSFLSTGTSSQSKSESSPGSSPGKGSQSAGTKRRKIKKTTRRRSVRVSKKSQRKQRK